jgi:CubicO group peptidase (beta-lactamase class C family)
VRTSLTVRVISRDSVEQMTRDQLPPGIKINFFPIPVLDVRPEAGNGFGLNVMVRTADGRGPIPGNIGDYTWPGIFGTYFWVDPKKELVVVIAICSKYWTQIRELVYPTLAN